jgi:type IV secretion system protein VirB6
VGIGVALETAVDTLLANYVTAKSAAVSAAIAPIALTGVTVYVLLMGYAIMRGEAHDSLHTFVWRSAKIAFVAGLALSAAEFQSSVIGLVEGIQGALTQALSGAPTLGVLIDDVERPYIALQTALWDQSLPTGIQILPSFSLIFAAVLVALAQFVLFIIAFGMYLLAKVALALVLAVGPAFILCAMFPATQRFAESWLGQALNFALLNVLIAASIAMLTQFASDFAGRMVGQIDAISILTDVGALLMATCAMGVVLLNLERLASALAGGVAIQGIGRDIGRALSGRLAVSSGQPRLGGQIQGGSRGRAAPSLPAPSGGVGPSGRSSGSTGGTIDAYQQRVQEQIRLSSTQGSRT